MKKLKTFSVLISLLVIASQLGESFADPRYKDSPVIYSVSTKKDIKNWERTGSVQGGTLLYILMAGINQTPSQNSVSVGPYRCDIVGIDQGVYLKCITSAASDNKIREKLTVKVTVSGQQAKCSADALCSFSYTQQSTPILWFMSPSTATPAKTVKWLGTWRMTSTESIEKLEIGGELCSLVNPSSSYDNLYDEQYLYADGWRWISCTASPSLQGGIYQIKSDMAKGTARTHRSVQKAWPSNLAPYHYQVVPIITALNQNSASIKGSELTISGNGFGQKKESVSVTIGNSVPCTVKSIQSDQIKCTFGEGTLQNSDFSGSGAQYTLYNLNGVSNYDTASQVKTGVDTGNHSAWPVLEQGILQELEFKTDAAQSGLYVRGWFIAQRTATHYFWLAGDNTAELWGISAAGSNNRSSLTLWNKVCSARQTRFYYGAGFDAGCDIPRSAGVSLTAGSQYYYEVFMRNAEGIGMVTASVEITTNEVWPNAMGEVQQINITYTPVRERYSVQVYNYTAPFSLRFLYQDPVTQAVERDLSTPALTWQQWTTSLFQYEVDKIIGAYGVRVVQNNDIFAYNSTTDIIGREWIFDVLNYRFPASNQANPQLDIAVPSSSFNIQRTVQPSAPVSGTFTLSYNGQSVGIVDENLGLLTNIPYNTEAEKLQRALQKILATDSIFVWTQKNAMDGFVYTIEFDHTLGNIVQLVANDALLAGGASATKPIIILTTLVNGSPNTGFFEPVSSPMINVQSTLEPHIKVKVNDVMAECSINANCAFSTSSSLTATINSFSVSTNQVSIDLSSGFAIALSDISITFGNAQCTSINATLLSNIICYLANDANGVKLEAGNWVPILLVANKGFAENGVNVTSWTKSMVISSITPSSGGYGGEYTATLAGSGFPFASNIAGLSVTFGSLAATIVSADVTQIVVTVPGQQSSVTDVNVTVAYNGVSNQIAFQYSLTGVPVISSISPTEASPVKKTTITINGSNFGTDKNNLKIYLDLGAQKGKYELFINTISDSQITAFLGGGITGTYTLRAHKPLYGSSINNPTFNYRITISSISPISGSQKGGQRVTITGSNFATVLLDNSVYFTYGTKSLSALVYSVSTTQIVVFSPANTYLWTGPVTISVSGRLIESSICTDITTNCQFTYNDTLTPSLNVLSSNIFNSGQQVTLLGTGFSGVGSAAIIHFGSSALQLPATITNDTQVTFTIPTTKSAGTYDVFVEIPTKGFAGIVEIQIAQTVLSLTPSTASLQGEDITITGSGLNPSTASVTLVGLGSCVITSSAINQITCRTPVATTNNTWTVQISHAGVPVACSGICTFQTTTTLESVVQNSTNSGQGFTASSFSIDISGLNLITPSAFLQLTGGSSTQRFAAGVQTVNSTHTLTFTNIPAGLYTLSVHSSGIGFASFQTAAHASVSVSLGAVTSNYPITAFYGGAELILTGSGFDSTNLNNNQVTIGGQTCAITSATFTQLKCTTPALVDPSTVIHVTQWVDTLDKTFGQSDFQLLVSQQKAFGRIGEYYAQNQYVDYEGKLAKMCDGYVNGLSADLSYPKIVNNTDNCFFGFDLGTTGRWAPYQIVYGLPLDYSNPYWLYTKIQASNDMTNWDNVYSLDAYQQPSTNIWYSASPFGYSTYGYRYIRVFGQNTSIASCEFTELISLSAREFRQVSSEYSNVQIGVNGKNFTLVNGTRYSADSNSNVSSISPLYNAQEGGTVITITGLGFGTVLAEVAVKIDGVVCAVTSVSQTQVQCTSGAKTNLNDPQSFSLTVKGTQTKILSSFKYLLYGLLWSHDATWGGDALPRQGDSVQVPKVNVEGKIVFADIADIEFKASYFIIRGGELLAGTETEPFSHKLTITLYGDEKLQQVPDLGSKVLGCIGCTLNIHGLSKTPSWTQLAASIAVNANSLTVQSATQWAVGDVLVIASTNFDAEESEKVTITAVNSPTNFTFTPALQFAHVGVQETFSNGVTVQMRAEVAVLSRNVKIQGDEASTNNNFGAQTLISGDAVDPVAKISNVEFTRVGQAGSESRHPLQFKNIILASSSFVKNVAIHQSYSRAIVLNSVTNLLIQDSVAYNTSGHAIYLPTGYETNNIIRGNLVLRTRFSSLLSQSEITPASFFFTNPQNTIENNHAAGSDFYGFVIAPVQNTNICPRGMQLTSFSGNVAHSNWRIGLRIQEHSARQYPCSPTRNDSLDDPYAVNNPAIQTTYSNFLAYKNLVDGVFVQKVGHTVFNQFYLVDNGGSGFNIALTNMTSQAVVLQNSIIVGSSAQNAQTPLEAIAKYGLVLPRTSGFQLTNTHFQFFDSTTASGVVYAVSDNTNPSKAIIGGVHSSFSGITFNSITSPKLKWAGNRANLIIDQDGSFSANNTGARYITPYYSYFDPLISTNSCTYDSSTNFGNSVICSTVLRDIRFTALAPETQFSPATSPVLQIKHSSQSSYTSSLSFVSLASDFAAGYAAFLPINNTFDLKFSNSADWSNVHVQYSHLATPSEDGILLRFNFQASREVFESSYVSQSAEGNPQQTFIQPVAQADLLAATCNFGSYYSDQTTNVLSLCASSKSRPSQFQILKESSFFCTSNCPSAQLSCTPDPVVKYWSTAPWSNVTAHKLPNQTNYTTGTPTSGDDVQIPCEWTLIIDTNLTLNNIIVDGVLKFDQTKDLTLSAHNIWIRGGTMKIGESTANLFAKFLTITLVASADTLKVDNNLNALSQTIVVTGSFFAYGSLPSTFQTALTSIVAPGATVINVVASTGWVVGDQILIAGSEFSQNDYEVRTITAKSTNALTLNQPLSYYHYGNTIVTVSKVAGLGEIIIDATKFAQHSKTLDMRAPVMHMTRKVKIIGASIIQYRWVYSDPNNPTNQLVRKGYFYLYSIELKNAGSTRFPALYALNTLEAGTATFSQFYRSIINGCVRQCFKAENAYYIQFYQANLFNAVGIMFDVKNSIQIRMLYTYFVGVKKETGFSGFRETAAVRIVESDISTMMIQYNLIAQSEGAGMIYPSTEYNILGPYHNWISACKVGLIPVSLGDKLHYISRQIISHCTYGIIISPIFTTKGFVLADSEFGENTQSIVLRQGTGNSYLPEITITNTWIGNLLRASAPSQAIYQNNNKSCISTGVVLLASTITNLKSQFPLTSDYDEILNIQEVGAAHGGLYIDQSEFYNFKQLYTPYASSGLCLGSYALASNPTASDSTAGTYITMTGCTNCDTDSYVKFADPQQSWLGAAGGCGSIDCSGLKNVLVQDFTGLFFQAYAQLVPNNIQIGFNASGCTYKSGQNGFYCLGTNFSILEIESAIQSSYDIGPLTLQSGTYNIITNAFRQRDFSNELQFARDQRLYQIVPQNRWYIATYAGPISFEMVHRIQQKNKGVGSPSEYVILQYYYRNTSLAIQVTVNGVVIVPELETTDLSTKSTVCGANKYYPKNQTIQFVVTGDRTCQVETRLVNSIYISLQLSADSSSNFWTQEVYTSFINKIAAYLGIQTYQLKFVGLSTQRRTHLRNLKEKQNAEINLIIAQNHRIGAFRRVDAPGTSRKVQVEADNEYNSANEYIEFREKAILLQHGFQSGELAIKNVHVNDVSYEIFVAKQPNNYKDMFTQSDLDKLALNKHESVSDLDILGYIGIFLIGFLSFIVISLIIYRILMNRKRQQTADYDPEVFNHELKKLQLGAKDSNIYIPGNSTGLASIFADQSILASPMKSSLGSPTLSKKKKKRKIKKSPLPAQGRYTQQELAIDNSPTKLQTKE